MKFLTLPRTNQKKKKKKKKKTEEQKYNSTS